MRANLTLRNFNIGNSHVPHSLACRQAGQGRVREAHNLAATFIFSVIIFFFSGVLSHPQALALTAEEGFRSGLDQTAEKMGYTPADAGADSGFFAAKAGSILGIALSFLGVIFFILMIYGGFLWMTSAGNEQKVSRARSILFNAAIGLIIVLAAYVITSLVGTEVASEMAG